MNDYIKIKSQHKNKYKQNITTLRAKIYYHLIDILAHNINVLQ